MPKKRVLKKSRVKKAKSERPSSRMGQTRHAGQWAQPRRIDADSLWRQTKFEPGDWNGLQVWVPVDPYTAEERRDFRAAMENPYVWRANRIIAKLVAGQGYTTEVVPRKEEDLPSEQLEPWQKTQKIFVPFFNEEKTPDQIKDFIDKMAKDMDLAENIFNGYFTSREQGRCVLAITPIDKNEESGKWQLPDSIRYIRPEFTLRPFLDQDSGELVGTQIVGLKSTQQFILPIERTIYITNAFNLELFSDFFGDSQVARVADCANVLNVIFSEDFLHAAEHTWHQPKVFGVPIQPQDFGNEETVLDTFLQKNSNNKGQDIAVVQDPDGNGGVTVLSQTTNSGDIAGLERIVVRCIKLILAYYNIPGFLLSEGETGKLGGNSNAEEVDMFINAEILPERIKLENMVEKQFYDRILSVLFDTPDAREIPVKLQHHFNKPRLASIFRADLYEIGKDMVVEGLMDKKGLIELVGVEQFTEGNQTASLGEDASPDRNTWRNNQRQNNRNSVSSGAPIITWKHTENSPKSSDWQPPQPFTNQHASWPPQKVVDNKGKIVWPTDKKPTDKKEAI